MARGRIRQPEPSVNQEGIILVSQRDETAKCGDVVFIENDGSIGAMEEKIEVKVGKLLVEKGLTLAVAESCTGGLVGHLLTNVPGSSEYFRGGVVAYAYGAKERLLGVRHKTLYEFGAVSEQTAREMARGARSALGADIGLSVTGIAGPGGGMVNKPVGLTWAAVSARDGFWMERNVWDGDREGNKTASAIGALALLLKVLEMNIE
ncbi:MAG: nicotinamide-nucleotide amidohydrolase family protein [Anaerolineales bacterium]|nr:nicotinamide-nucleotide amidohydrolase family protein [Anaerolineales bacterium]